MDWSAHVTALLPGLIYQVRSLRSRYADAAEPSEDPVLQTQAYVTLLEFTAQATEHDIWGSQADAPDDFFDIYGPIETIVAVTPAGTVKVTILKAYAPYETPEIVVADVLLSHPDRDNAIFPFDAGIFWIDEIEVDGVLNVFRLHQRVWDVAGARTRSATQEAG